MVKIIFLFFYIILSCSIVQAEPISLAVATTSAWVAAHAAAMAIASAVAVTVSTALGVTSAVIQGRQQKAVAKYNQQVNLQNAAAQRQAAQAKIENQRRQLMFTQGAQLAKLGGMGALAEGTPLDLLGQTAGQGKYDQLVTEYEGEVGAIQFQQKAALNQYEADVAGYNTVLNTSTKVAEGAGKVGSLLGGMGGLDSTSTTWGKADSGGKLGSVIDKSTNKEYIKAPLSSGLM